MMTDRCYGQRWSTTYTIRTRSCAGTAPGHWERAWLGLCHRDVLSRMALALVAAVAVCAIIQAWDPPIHWRTGMVPTRYVTARVEFKQENENETEQARLKAREETKAVFIQDVKPLEQLRADLRNTIAELTKTETLTEKTRPAVEGIPAAALEKGRESAQAPGGTCRLPGVPQGPGRQGEPRSTRSRGGRGLCPLGAIRPAGRAHGEAQGFQQEDHLGLLGRESGAQRRDVEVSEVTVDPQAIRQKLAEGLELEGDRRPGLRLARAAAAAPLQALDHVHARRRGEQGGPGRERRQGRAGDDHLPAGRSAGQGGRIDRRAEARVAQGWNTRHFSSSGRFATASAGAARSCWWSSPCSRSAGCTCATGSAACRPNSIAWPAPWAWPWPPWSWPCGLAGDPWRAEPVPLIVFGMTMAIAYRQELALLVHGRRFLDRRAGAGRESAHVPAVVRHDGRRGAEPGPHPQPQQAGLRRPVCRLRGRLAGPGHEHDRQPAPGPGRCCARPAANSSGPRWPGSS